MSSAPPDLPVFGTDKTWSVPETWAWTTMGQIAQVIGGGTPRTNEPANFEGGRIPWITPADLSGYPDTFISRGARNITERGLTSSSARLLPEGTVLFSSRAPIGYVAIATQPLTTNQGFKSFVLPDEIDPSYVYHYLRRAKDIIVSMASGTTFREISGAKAAEIPIPIAPLPEQRRIVAEIETQFTRLDAAVAALERARANLKRYRAAVLAAAVSGRLTRPQQDSTSDGDFLPSGWHWSSWEKLSRRVTVGWVGPMKHEYVPTGIPFLRSQNIRENRFDPEGLLYISPEFHQKIAKSRLKPGDLAVVRSGSVGVTCVVPESLPEANCADLVLIQGPTGILPQFGSYYMNSLAKRAIAAGRTGSALTHFNTKSVAALPVPVPPIDEQREIVEEVERRLSIIDEMDATMSSNLKRAQRTRQAILRKAFVGQLVPQDPTDEPASVLLERIRAGRNGGPRQGTLIGIHLSGLSEEYSK